MIEKQAFQRVIFLNEYLKRLMGKTALVVR